jgi:hypothetical protein
MHIGSGLNTVSSMYRQQKGNIFGETKESCLAAIDKVLERIENPLAAVTEERAAYLQQEKEFYTVLASKIRE